MANPHPVKIKICGMTNAADAHQAVALGADAVGFIFYKKSPRAVGERQVRAIVDELPPLVHRVGVFVNETEARINRLVARLHLDVVQLHGDETPAFCKKIHARVLKAVRVKDQDSLAGLSRYPVTGFLLDAFESHAYGGTGQGFDWALAQRAKQYGPVILAGGLNPDNVAEAVRMVQPYGVDVCSGVEKTPGRKDFNKLRAFIQAVRGVNQE